MGLMSLARRTAFWTMDALKGGPIRKAYNDIKKIDETDSDSTYVIRYQEQAWKNLKEHACANTKAYAPYSSCEFEDFPIISKQDIRQAQEDYMSCSFDRERLITMSTSGSTGTPFVCYQNGFKKRRVNAEVIYYSEKVGYRLGDNLSYIRTIVKQNKKSGFKQFIQNQTLINCGQLSDQGVELLIDELAKRSRKGLVTLLAYGSTYTALKDYFLKKGISELGHHKIVGAISGSDMLFDETRTVIAEVFGNIPVVSRYSNEENGVLGQDEGINNVFSLNEANYIIEIVDDAGNPVEEGVCGRIVVTDLYNYAMPMIRYDTGDVGAIQTFEISGRRKKAICQFAGRRVDVIFDADGNALSPHVLTNYMWEFPEITQFQLIQTGDGQYCMKLNVDESFHREEEVVAVLYQMLGERARIRIEKVAEIPVLASGKRRYIVNEWK